MILSSKAIVRKPGNNFAKGISSGEFGVPDFDLTLIQHTEYCQALKAAGLELIILEADPNYPDGCFVEDTAIVTEQCAIITRPGADSRRGEELKIKKCLSAHKVIEEIKYPGTLDGGDILRVEDHFYFGLSERTNREGADQLKRILNRYNYTSSIIEVGELLHLKSGVNYIGNNTLFCVASLVSDFSQHQLILIPEEEEYAANCVLVNDHLLIAKGFPKMKAQVEKLNVQLIELEMSEFQKMDGGLTCLSLIF